MCTGFTALAEETTKNDSPFSILFQPFTCHFSAISEKENHRDRPWASGQSRPVALRCRRRWYALRPAGEGLKSSQVFPGIFVVSFRWTDLYCKRFGIFGSSELILKWFTWFGGDSALDSKKHILWDERRAFDMQSILGWIAAKSWNRLVIALAKIIYIYIYSILYIYIPDFGQLCQKLIQSSGRARIPQETREMLASDIHFTHNSISRRLAENHGGGEVRTMLSFFWCFTYFSWWYPSIGNGFKWFQVSSIFIIF